MAERVLQKRKPFFISKTSKITKYFKINVSRDVNSVPAKVLYTLIF